MLIPVTNRKLRSVSYSVIPRWKKIVLSNTIFQKQRAILEGLPNTKGINHPALGSPFPEYEKDDKDQDSKKVDQKVMAFLQVQILLLSVRTCCHLGSAPSIKD